MLLPAWISSLVCFHVHWKDRAIIELSCGVSGMEKLIERIKGELLAQATIESVDPLEPVKVRSVPKPWRVLGTGNYAAVFYHPEAPDYAVKVYAPGRPGLAEEAEVYRRLGRHPAFSECYYSGPDFLILKRLQGVTFYDSMKRGFSSPRRPSKILTARWVMPGPADSTRMMSTPRM